MTDSRTKITHIIINDHDQHISAASTADVILAMPEIAEAQTRIAELEDLLGRYANAVADAEGVFFEPEDAEGEYIIEMAKRARARARAKKKPLPKPKPGQFSVPQIRS